jgi:hypothetical protein
MDTNGEGEGDPWLMGGGEGIQGLGGRDGDPGLVGR